MPTARWNFRDLPFSTGCVIFSGNILPVLSSYTSDEPQRTKGMINSAGDGGSRLRAVVM